ncbi:type II toxin-antitoxin system RatA family toxin [Streptomyces sp. NPDC001933]|uniref:type II toxin-antitoxin system RatA family toxin n=1 Tax=Streptomyces sp. NPDC001933 TaxID=3364626 RepID=UPI0036BD636D
MPVVSTRHITGESPERVWAALLDCEAFPSYMTEVAAVDVLRQEGERRISRWSVQLRGSELEWEEEDLIDPARRRIDFRQTEGDLARYTGHWQVGADGARTTVELEVDFDLGIPLMAEMLDPIAKRALRDFSQAVLGSLGERAAGAAAGTGR